MKSFAIVAVVISLFLPHRLRAGSKPNALEVIYLGNEGFLVRSGSLAVLFDAFFGAGLPDYDRVPANAIRDVDTGQSPFTHIDVVFISHVHATTLTYQAPCDF